MIRHCPICGTELVQRSDEPDWNFRRRQACGIACGTTLAAQSKRADRHDRVAAAITAGANGYDIADQFGTSWRALRTWAKKHAPGLIGPLTASLSNPRQAPRQTAPEGAPPTRSIPIPKTGRTTYGLDRTHGGWYLACGLCGRRFARASRRAVLKLAQLHSRTHMHDQKGQAA
ncbi:MAG: hypothetical protein Q4G35_08270 [Propionibacteriaceae bacterium]|nr:hypothetical protein [Propionibacteriaceae bacterium]